MTRINLLASAVDDLPTLDAPLAMRFWTRVTRLGAHECWLWQGALPNEYGRFYIGKRAFKANRVARAIIDGRWPDTDAEVMHSCDNRPCCNPRHLIIGTTRDNGRAKLGDEKLLELLELRKRGVSTKSLAADYGLTVSYVRHLVAGAVPRTSGLVVEP